MIPQQYKAFRAWLKSPVPVIPVNEKQWLALRRTFLSSAVGLAVGNIIWPIGAILFHGEPDWRQAVDRTLFQWVALFCVWKCLQNIFRKLG